MADWWEKYRRVPFKEHGRDETGADCWGYTRLIYKRELGILLPSYAEAYDNSQDAKIGPLIDQEIETTGEWIEVENPASFDFVLMKLSAAGPSCHVGLVIRPFHMIHLRRRSGVVIQDWRRMECKNLVTGFMRYVPRK